MTVKECLDYMEKKNMLSANLNVAKESLSRRSEAYKERIDDAIRILLDAKNGEYEENKNKLVFINSTVIVDTAHGIMDMVGFPIEEIMGMKVSDVVLKDNYRLYLIVENILESLVVKEAIR
ncbi:MAG: hypothetical protein DRH57_00185 [Candidatus Cloacimonadota bacterium]|nr:MAG: hypothetical protein DRH57_00185 [Candidatus Cloacimonadota bacterium]